MFKDDEVAFNLWRGCGLPPERITRLGEKTNYWPANAIQPNSRRGRAARAAKSFSIFNPTQPFDTDWDGEGSRWLEIWNLVFTQFTGEGTGADFKLIPLPEKEHRHRLRPGADGGGDQRPVRSRSRPICCARSSAS